MSDETILKVVFCGKGHFETGYILTKKNLETEKNVIVDQCTREELESTISDATVIVPLMSKITQKEIINAKKLKMIYQFGVGLEGVDVQFAINRGIWVCKIKSDECGNAQSCAEHSIYLALSLLRDQKGMSNSVKTGKLGFPTGRTLLNSNAVIYGYGGIGQQLFHRLKSFGTKITIVKRNISSTDIVKEDCSTTRFVETNNFLHDVASKEVDLLFLCCNQNEENVGMINEYFISKLKHGCLIINVARVILFKI
jgi:phosphoglycerate dehydrogenase-like enzyme